MLDKNNRFNYGVDSGSGNAQNLSNLQNAYPSSRPSWLSMGVKGAVLGLGLATLLPLTAFAASPGSGVAYSDYPGPEGYQWDWPVTAIVGGNYLNTVDVKWDPVQPVPAVIPPDGIHVPYGTPINDDFVLGGQITVIDKDGKTIDDPTATGQFRFVIEHVYYPVSEKPYNIFAYYFLDKDKSTLETDDYDGCQHQYLYVSAATPELEWDTPEAITYGTPLSVDQLNAKCITIDAATIDTAKYGKKGAILDGEYTYSPDFGEVLDATQTKDGEIILPPGTHTLTVTFVPWVKDTKDRNENYTIVTKTVELIVYPADLTDDQFKWGDPTLDVLTYGDEFTKNNIHYTTTVEGEISTDPDMLDTYPDANENGYPLDLTFTPNSRNYNPVTAKRPLIVKKADPKLEWETPARVEKGTLFAKDATATGIDAKTLPGTFVYDPAFPVTLDQVPEQTLKATFTPTDTVNYNTAEITKTVEVFTKTPVILTWATPDPITYGTPLALAMEMNQRGIKVDGIQLNALATTEDGIPVDGRYVYIPEEGNVLPMGTHKLTVTFTPTDTNTYETVEYTDENGLNHSFVWLEVTKAALTITADSETIKFNDPVPTYTYQITSGALVPGDTLNVKLSCDYKQGDDVGEYAIIPSLDDASATTATVDTVADNYDITFVNGKLTVEPADLSDNEFHLDYIEELTYGDAFTMDRIHTSGTVEGTLTTDPVVDRIPNANEDGYALKVTFTPNTKNYNPKTIDGTLIVHKATPNVTWNPKTPITYGTPLSKDQLNATFTWNVDGVGEVTVDGTATYSPEENAILNAGTRTLKLVSFKANGDSFRKDHPENYNEVKMEVDIEVEPAALTITADDQSITFDAEAPKYTYTVEGFVNGEDESDLLTPVEVNCVYQKGDDVGEYPIVPSGATSDNYEITFVDGTLYVGVKEPDILWAKPDPMTVGDKLVRVDPIDDWDNCGIKVDGIQLNALAVEDKTDRSTRIEGSYEYIPAEGTVMNKAGVQTLTVNFYPVDGNYKAATATIEVLVQVKPVITWGDQEITYGDTMGKAFTATITPEEVTNLGKFIYHWGNTTSGDVVPDYAKRPVGTYTLTVEFVLNSAVTTYAQPDPVTANVIIKKATPIIHWNDPRQPGTYELVPPGMEPPEPPVYQLADITYGTELTDADQLNAYVTGGLKGSMIYTVPSTKLPAGWNTLYATFTPDINDKASKNYDAVTVFNLIYVKYADLDEVVWDKPADITYGTPLSDAQYSNLMYGKVGDEIIKGTAADQNPALGEILTAGEHTLNATFVPNDPNYNRVEGQTQTLTVNKAKPTLSIGQEPTNPQEIIEIDYGTLIDPTDPKINASAKGYDGSELKGDFTFEAYEYDPDADDYVLIDKDPTREYLDVLAEGNPQYKLRAIFTPTGDDADNYESETYVEKGLNVLRAEPTVEVKDIQVPYGTELTVDDLTALVTVKGVKTEDGQDYENVEGTCYFLVNDVPFADIQQPLVMGSYTLTAVFIPSAEEINYFAGEGTGTIDIYGDLIPEWEFETPITYGTLLTDAYFQAIFKDAQTGEVVNGTAEYNIDGTPVKDYDLTKPLSVGTYQLNVKFTPNDTAKYKKAPYPATRTLEVIGKNPNALWFPFPMFYGQTPGDNQYNAKADVSGSFDYPEKPVWPTEVGEYDLNAPFTPEDKNYSKVDPVIGHLVILKAPIRFVWPAQDMYYGETPTDEKQFNAKAISTVTGEEVEGTFDYPRDKMPTAVGVYTLVAPWTPKDTRNYESGIAYANIEIFGADPTADLTWNPAALEYGKEAGDAQKNASSGTIAGHFEYPNMDGYNAGEYQVTANFISEDPNYTNGEVTATLKVTQAAPTIKFYKVVPAEEEGKDPTYEEIVENKIPMTYGQILKLNDDNTITITTEEDEEAEVESASEFLTNDAISENNKEGEEEEESESEDMTIKVFVTGIDKKDVAGTVTFTLDGVELPDLEQPLEPKEDPYKLKATFTSENANYANGNASIDVTVEVEEGAVDVDWEVRDFYPWSEGLVWGDFAWKDAVAWNAYTEEPLAWEDQLTYKYAEVDPDLVPSGDIDEMTLEEALKALNLTLEDLRDFEESNPADAGTYFLVAWYDDPTYGYGEDKDICEIAQATPDLEIGELTFTYGTILYPGSFECYAYGTDGNYLTGDIEFYVDEVPLEEVDQPLEFDEYDLTVVFTPDNTNYESVELEATLNIIPSADIIEVLWDVPAVITYGDEIALNAKAVNTIDGEVLAEGDELQYSILINNVEYELFPGVILDAGIIYQVKATFVGAGDYEGVEKDTGWLPVAVEPAEPTLSWNPDPLVYGTAATKAQENASANVDGKFTYPDMSKLPVGKNNVTATFTSADPNYTGGEVSAVLEVTKATPVIRWATPAPIYYGTLLSDEQLNATANVDGTFKYTPAAGAELEIGTYTLTTVFTPKDTANYNTATASVELEVIPNVEVEITWEPKSPITYGTVLSVEQLNATANVEGHFYYNPSYGFVLTPESQFVVNGKLRLSVIFIPTDRKHFKNAYKEVFIDIVTDEDEDDEDTTDDGDDAPALTISKAGSAKGLVNAAADALVITFTGTLEESTDGVTWTPVADAKDGTYVVDVKVASKKFYRSVK